MSASKFRLPDTLGDLPDSEQQVVVVSFFGKSPYLSRCCKAGVIDESLGRQLFRPSLLTCTEVDSESLCNVEGYLDSKNKVVYLHLSGMFDVHALISSLASVKSDIQEKGYLTVWSKLKYSYARALLFLFSVSHVLVLVHPTHVFDASYIQLFRALDSVRQKILGSIGDLLSTVPGVSKEWAQHGRLCTPRLLFLFESCPTIFKDNSANDRSTASPKNSKGSSIKKLEHALEDQIYHVLRRNRIVTKNNANSLFAIPANEEFVFVQTSIDPMQDWHSHMIDSLIDNCKSPTIRSDGILDEYAFHTPSFINEIKSKEHTFKRLLQQHIDQAFHKGFDDIVSRHLTPVHFEIPSFKAWRDAVTSIFDSLIKGNELSPSNSNQNEALDSLCSLLDTDVKFSESRCGKVLPVAIATYQENLPSHYTREYHKARLAHALSFFAAHARGPLFQKYAAQLETECEQHWKAGRQMCQVLSLTGNPCTKPLHRGGGPGAGGGELNEENKQDRSSLPEMDHCSGVRYVTACNCGRKQGPREDPFNVLIANHDFYVQIGNECGCNDLESVKFPVFTPSTKDFRAAQLFSDRFEENDSALCRGVEGKESGANTSQGNTLGFNFGHSDGSDITEEASNNLHLPHSGSEPGSGSSAIVIRVSDSESDNFKEKGLVRQPSTTEYLPGMLHSGSPSGLLPQFPSWSLVCLGPSSLYSHNLGLQEQQQAGLMPGSAFLLPWDLTVRLEPQRERLNAWPTVGDAAFSRNNKSCASSMLGRSRKTRKDAAEFVVKIFVGIEYECPRGHRFMCSAPDKVLKTSGSGLVKDNGNKVTGNDMPLYFPCPCKSSKPLIAQLMRVHVVTPKAPVHVTLNPRVQPAPSPCPVFGPGCDKPIRLSQSAYWVLRLPYVYLGDHGPYVSPKEPVPITYSRLLAGMYGIIEVPLEK